MSGYQHETDDEVHDEASAEIEAEPAYTEPHYAEPGTTPNRFTPNPCTRRQPN